MERALLHKWYVAVTTLRGDFRIYAHFFHSIFFSSTWFCCQRLPRRCFIRVRHIYALVIGIKNLFQSMLMLSIMSVWLRSMFVRHFTWTESRIIIATIESDRPYTFLCISLGPKRGPREANDWSVRDKTRNNTQFSDVLPNNRMNSDELSTYSIQFLRNALAHTQPAR